MSKRRAAAEVAAGLVLLHEHEKDLKQERRLANRPNFGDRVPTGMMLCILVGLTMYGLALLVIAIWPWLLAVAALGAAGILWRRHNRKKGTEI